MKKGGFTKGTKLGGTNKKGPGLKLKTDYKPDTFKGSGKAPKKSV